MKSKKGFTVVELIIVVAILAVIAGIFTANIIRTSNKNKEEEHETVVTQIKSAANVYVSTNPEEVEKLYTGYGYVDIKVGELRDAGLLSEGLKNPETGETISDDEVVRVRLETGDEVGFTYPVSKEEVENTKAWTLIAQDLYVEYDANKTVDSWCNTNEFIGLYDGTDTSIPSKLYLEDNEGTLFKGDYFGSDSDVNLTVTSCNVDPSVAGSYLITYTFNDPDLGSEKVINRNVYVGSSDEDVVSFTATINDNRNILINSENVSVKIIEAYKNGDTNSIMMTTDNMIGYTINGFNATTAGTRVATISRMNANSDGSFPTQAQDSYTVTSSVADYLKNDNDCKISAGNSNKCFFKGKDPNNNAEYNGTDYKIVSIDGNIIKLIYSGPTIWGNYGQLGNCTNSGCCNSGRHVYNGLGSTAVVPNKTMDTILDEFYINKNVAGPKLQSQNTIYGAKKIALLTLEEYWEISGNTKSINIANQNYLVGTEFWLIDPHSSYAGAVAYNRGSQNAYVYHYTVMADGKYGYKGSVKGTTSQGDYSTDNVNYHRLSVRPTIVLNNPTSLGGDGTPGAPYILK